MRSTHFDEPQHSNEEVRVKLSSAGSQTKSTQSKASVQAKTRKAAQ